MEKAAVGCFLPESRLGGFMKKLIAISIALVLFAGVAFAQVADGIGLGVWGHIGFTFLDAQLIKDPEKNHNKDNDLSLGLGSYWGTYGGRAARLQFSGSSEYIGFKLWLQTDGLSVGLGDSASIWVKPWDFLMFELGKFNNDTLRGKVGDTLFNTWVLYSGDNDSIFQRFAGRPGAMISLTPVEGLFVGAKINVTNKPNAYDSFMPIQKDAISDPTDPRYDPRYPWIWDNAADIYRYIQAGVGYEIKDVGHARFQYLGAQKQEHPGFELAFALTSVENMMLDIGFKLPLPYKENYNIPGGVIVLKDTTFFGAAEANLGFTMGMDAFSIEAIVCTSFGSGISGSGKVGGTEYAYQIINPFVGNIHIVPAFDLGFATLGIELGTIFSGKSKSVYKVGGTTKTRENDDNTFQLGAGVWLMKEFDHGSVKAGFTYTTTDLVALKDSSGPTKAGFFRIPVVLEVYF